MVLPFADPVCLDVARAGGKGASLARATSLGLPVPPGYVVCADTFLESLGNRAEDLRAHARARDHAATTALVAELRGPDLTGVVAELGVPVAVRSSAVAEDSETASFAGQQETYLGVGDAATASARVVDCWASFFTERALFYRARRGSLDDLRMAVVIQAMVEADVAGVLFTADPVSRRRDQMIVESVFGLGEPAVAGTITPDNYVIDREGRLKRSRIAIQPFALVGGVERPLTSEEGGARTLSDDDLVALAALGRRLEKELGAPQDIEWAIAAGSLYLLQSRPVTTL
jgi:pyruvate,water dikinase